MAVLDCRSHFKGLTAIIFSTMTEPLTALLKKRDIFKVKTYQEAFDRIKSILLSEPVLMAPSFKEPFSLFADASDICMGAALLQEDANRMNHPVCYYSREFNSHQHNYSTVEKEALALVLSLQHFKVYLSPSVNPVQNYTNHNPLTYIQRIKNHNK